MLLQPGTSSSGFWRATPCSLKQSWSTDRRPKSYRPHGKKNHFRLLRLLPWCRRRSRVRLRRRCTSLQALALHALRLAVKSARGPPAAGAQRGSGARQAQAGFVATGKRRQRPGGVPASMSTSARQGRRFPRQLPSSWNVCVARTTSPLRSWRLLSAAALRQSVTGR